MQHILPVWRRLTTTRKAIVIGSTLAIFIAVLGMSRLLTQPRMTLLYSGLEPAAAGEVVQALQQKGIAFEVRGTSVLVPESSRDQLRLTLASEGLPASAGQGYELLDSLTGFGTTSQMFDAAYLRAKEEELARTIVSSPEIVSARVHIATGSDNPFRRDLAPSASVHVTARSGAIDRAKAQAIRHSVASAVAGLLPENVSLVDAHAGLLTDEGDAMSSSTDRDRSDLLRERVLRLLEARVGRGNAVVEVSIDSVTDTESITERRFDPDSRFVISSDSEERTDQSENGGSGAVTVASNLPDGDANSSETETRQSSELRERLNYEVSQTTREIIRAPGAIRRLTVAVLVNGRTETDAQGAEIFVPVPDEDLAALQDLVESAVGFDEARGDVITLKSLPFEPLEVLGSEPTEQPWFNGPLNPMTLIQIAVLTFVVLILGLFVVRPLLAPSRQTQLLAAPSSGEVGGNSTDLPVLNGTIEPEDAASTLPVLAEAARTSDLPAPEDAVARLKTLIEERRSETVEVLRSWLDEPQAGDAR
ncbi:flagellar basal-body MS-ring/collar protein FliF [Marivita geojedonensis]|uniref:Flagellar M-ring protein n=1 Tax=Marivita geojedonensis TaxID=1123756 RepID=A0A1X4NL50_9RHOB|nr:flagellar basal-body MS-ring/collar protein FliF [Marivita geojedonensis]OSQ51006.1 flagellar M-ring protein FliF [Marivita geojedonensis]PRY79997.1 flagellar M-ring protein FliF [Marivita geojedonensis]